MAIMHIVLFGWKETASKAQIDDACTCMLALREKCVRLATQKPYIKSSSGGKNNSPEYHNGASSHGFVVEFENEEDREYYLTKDPEHLAYTSLVGELVKDIRVLDYTPGQF